MESNASIKGYQIVNLADMIIELGEDMTKHILLNFSCHLNRDIENFLHYKSIEFSKQALARTHLVFCSYKSKLVLVAYFALANKFIQVEPNALSKTLRKRITKFGTFYSSIKKYIISAPLIAQLGKNYEYENENLITGDEILKMACDKIREVQLIAGGNIVYVECEDIPKLKEFYLRNGFVEFGKRRLDNDERDDLSGDYLIQMVKCLHKSVKA
ncbi:MAG: N-acetyltransferase [Acetivibrionales bacterium]|mgnify:CR=1 FL=1|jgi:hypothetical protein